MKTRLLAATTVAACGLIAGLTQLPATAHPGHTHHTSPWDPVDGPAIVEEDHQHGGEDGHLPASNKNVALLGKVKLTDVDGGIADVAGFGRYAYLNAWGPECAGKSSGEGGGVHVVDVSDPANPVKVNFLPAEPGNHPGEGVHVYNFNGRHILVHNNEICSGANPATVKLGFTVWDVTDPRNAFKIGQFGDPAPRVGTMFHSTHSVQGFSWQGKAYAVTQDSNELKDVDIFDITPAINGTGDAVLVWEGGLEDWPAAHGNLGFGNTVNHHDMQQQVIGGKNMLLVSYWDAGQILLDISNPAAPVFKTQSDFTATQADSEYSAEGNSHQSYWSADGKYVLSSDEDFSPTRTFCRITTGTFAGQIGCGEFGFTPDLGETFPDGFEGTTVFGGSGCVDDLNGNGTSDRAELRPASETGATVAVFSRGSCFFSDKIRTAEEAGYTMVAIGQSHGGTRNGMLPDSFSCGGQGSPILGTAPAICIGHKAMHDLFASAPAYTGPEGYTAGGDLPAIGAVGDSLSARGGVFDGWGYVRLHQADDLSEIDSYAVEEANDPAFASGFGNLTVHEVKTDPRPGTNLAYLSYYDAGLRVVKFGPGGIQEIGHSIAEGGNDFWGVYPLLPGNSSTTGKGRPYLLMSDRDYGLWIYRYTGAE